MRKFLWGRWYVEGALFIAIAIWSTWPLATQITSGIPLGIEMVGVVPEYSQWILWWHSDRLANLGSGYWDAPMFHPHPDALGFSEPMFLQGWAVAPVWWLGGTPALAYNLVILGGLTVNGWAACRLVRSLRFGWIASLGGGAMVEMVPLVHQQLGVLPLLAIFGVVWTLHAAHRFGMRPSVRRGVWLGAAFAATYLSCNHFALFLSIMLLAGGVWLVGTKLRKRSTWLGFLTAVAVVVTLTGPFVASQLRAKEDQGFSRSRQTMLDLSARPSSYLAATWPQAITLPPSRTAVKPQRLSYWPGSIKALLAVVAIGAVFVNRRSKWTIFCALFFTLSAALSMGMHLHVGSFYPYQKLAELYPGLSQIRNIWRFTFFAQLAVALLAAVGLEMLFGRVGERFAGRTPPSARARRSAIGRLRAKWTTARSLRGALLAVVALVAAFEIRPAAARIHPAPASEPGWTTWLMNNTPEDAVVAFYPFPRGTHIKDFVPTGQWLYHQMTHRRRMLNGYSSYFPRPYVELQKEMLTFPSTVSVGQLRKRGASFLVLRPAAGEAPPDLDGYGLRQQYVDQDAGVTVYAFEQP